MSTPSERLEAMVWLESTYPNIPEPLRKEYLAAVDIYYAEYPVADRGAHFLEVVKEETQAFAEILRSIIGDEDPPSPRTD